MSAFLHHVLTEANVPTCSIDISVTVLESGLARTVTVKKTYLFSNHVKAQPGERKEG